MKWGHGENLPKARILRFLSGRFCNICWLDMDWHFLWRLRSRIGSHESRIQQKIMNHIDELVNILQWIWEKNTSYVCFQRRRKRWKKLKQKSIFKIPNIFPASVPHFYTFPKLFFEASALYGLSAESSSRFNALYDSNRESGFLWSCHRFDQSYLNLRNTLLFPELSTQSSKNNTVTALRTRFPKLILCLNSITVIESSCILLPITTPPTPVHPIPRSLVRREIAASRNLLNPRAMGQFSIRWQWGKLLSMSPCGDENCYIFFWQFLLIFCKGWNIPALHTTTFLQQYVNLWRIYWV